jgi:Holliday junction resolvasome RuvABC DNA-binding subunit
MAEAGLAEAPHFRGQVPVDEDNVRALVEMGFAEAQAVEALQQAGNSMDRALGAMVG